MDNSLVINQWNNTTSSFWHQIVTPSKGTHRVVIQYKDATSSASLRFETGSPYRTLDLRTPANITAQDITTFFKTYKPGSALINDAQSYLDAQNTYGVNAAYLVAHSVLETGWGASNLSVFKHNLYGYSAYDVCPFTCGYYFPTDVASMNLVAYDVKQNYLTPGGSYYLSEYGPNLIGMNVYYATGSSWYSSIASLMDKLKPYDTAYYSTKSARSTSATQPSTYGRDIPTGQALPTSIRINFPSGTTATVNRDVNFRSTPYVTQSTLIKALAKGTPVTVLGYDTDVSYNPSSTGNYQYYWYRVLANGQNGWVYGQFLDIQNLLQVTASTLNIRQDPSTTNAPITPALSNGQYVEAVLGTDGQPVMSNGWYQIQVPNTTQTGWVSGDFITRITH